MNFKIKLCSLFRFSVIIALVVGINSCFWTTYYKNQTGTSNMTSSTTLNSTANNNSSEYSNAQKT